MSSAELQLNIQKIKTDTVNEVSLNSPTSSLNGEERVLIEKDGKFELIKAREMEAFELDPTSPEVDEIPVVLRESKQTLSQPNHLKNSHHKRNETDRTDSNKRRPAMSSTIPRPSTVRTNTGNSTSSLPQSKRRSRPNTQPHTPTASPSRLEVRPRTAPLDNRVSYSLYSMRDSGRRELAEAAFRAWLDMKDKQLIEVSRNKPEHGIDLNTCEVEKRSSEAYVTWMKNKRKQVLTELDAKDKKTTNVSKESKMSQSQTTFEKWLKKKSKKDNFAVTLTACRKQKQK